MKLTEEESKRFKKLAEKAGCTMKDYCLSKIFDIPLEEPEEKVYIKSARKYKSKYKKKLTKKKN